jgi:hypothetical protein
LKKVTGGDGSDTTAEVLALLQASASFRMANLFLIGDQDDPTALYLTDYESPLLWSAWGLFKPASIKRGTVSSKIGLEVSTLDVEYHPPASPATQSIATANAFQKAQLGYFDNLTFRAWTVYMPTPGDANTYGASELFGGRIGSVSLERGAIKFTVHSFLDVVNQPVPLNVIEVTNQLAAYAGATPPAGLTRVPQFAVVSPSYPNWVRGDCLSPTAHQIFDNNVFQNGFLVFNGTSATLAGRWSAIQANWSVNIAGTNYCQFQLLTPLPWTPTAGDTFYVSAAFPINKDDPQYKGFPYVPSPEQGF